MAEGPSKNTRPKTRVSYRELDELSEEDIAQLTSSRARRQLHTPSRRSQRAAALQPSYNEQSSDTSSESSEEESNEETKRPKKRRRLSPRIGDSPRLNQNSAPSTPRPSSRGQTQKRRSTTIEGPTSLAQNIPPWQSLPYHILRQIFEYAAYPVYDSPVRPSYSIYWLLDSSRLCRSFHEAAISTLLESPPLYRVRNLLRLLKRSPEALSMNFQSKIRKLDVEVKHLLAGKKRPLDLPALIRLSPQLKYLRLYHVLDEMGVTLWSRPSTTSKATRWDYSKEIFDALDETNIFLERFEWNGRFSSSTKAIEDMPKWHDRQAFQRLESLMLLNLATSDKASEQEEGKYEMLLMDAISKLPNIRRLSFQNCTVVNERLFAHLPQGLQSLIVVDCVSLTSMELSAFLRDKGMSLINLRLDSNQSLDLAFATNLAISCPRLQVFKMDLTYYDASAYHDVEPYFDHLLPTGPPSWPSSLQTLDLNQLRSWDMEAADGFFQSLEDAAPNLPDLRFLSLKAILKSGWRDRALFRNKWKARLEKVFLRKWENPSDNRSLVKSSPVESDVQSGSDRRTSIIAATQAEESNSTPTTPIFPGLVSHTERLSRPGSSNSEADQTAPQRKSARIPIVAAQRMETLRQEEAIAAAEEEKAHLRRQALAAAKKVAVERQKEEEREAKAKERRQRHSRASTMKAEEDEEGGEGNGIEVADVHFIQGLCNTVLFRIDDQRPAEAQFKEVDFMEEEMSGDEDWNGVDIDFEEDWVRRRGRRRKYAW